MQRIEHLRQEALCTGHSLDEFKYKFYKRYGESKETDEYARYGEAFSAAFESLTPYISDGELIVGRIVNALTDEQKESFASVYKQIADGAE